QSDGSLTSRRLPNAMVHDAQAAAGRVIRMVKEGRVKTESGSDLEVRADTVCIHGDAPGVLEFAKAIRQELEKAKIEVRALRS
ncbi:MAG: LamB/YcsF family protein, partial [Acidobacteriia bacterium]|nr:LamB/YcsF family protein [Terriglobia bacterium]